VESIKELFWIGIGPSSSHTMGPRRAAEIFRERHPSAAAYRATLFGNLAATSRGHLTDAAIKSIFNPNTLEITWKPEKQLLMHSNGMRFEALSAGRGKMPGTLGGVQRGRRCLARIMPCLQMAAIASRTMKWWL